MKNVPSLGTESAVKLAISNIAWPAEETPEIFPALKSLGFHALEIGKKPGNTSRRENS